MISKYKNRKWTRIISSKDLINNEIVTVGILEDVVKDQVTLKEGVSDQDDEGELLFSLD